MSILSSAATLDELLAMVRVRFSKSVPPIPADDDSKAYCYRVLIQVSRSFATVIQELPDELRDAVCVFYLVLRALDTVEDDTKYPEDKKVPLLLEFHERMQNRGFTVTDCPVETMNSGNGLHYKDLMLHFDRVVEVYLSLDQKYQDVIKDITQRMGRGMAEFIYSKGVDTVDDYNLYCHYVAGLVGHGLSNLFVQSGLEDETLDSAKNISNSMGLLLQKANIIRDYFEDIVEDRIFWPREVWSRYADDIADFRNESNTAQAVHCLNHLVTEALTQVPDCLEYMRRLKNQKIFNFCAIPQVMAMATLAEIYNNPDVFRKNVKIRKGMAAKLIMNTRDIGDVGRAFHYFIEQIEKKIDPSDPNAQKTSEYIKTLKHLTQEYGTFPEGTSLVKALSIASVATVAGAALFFKRDAIREVVHYLVVQR